MIIGDVHGKINQYKWILEKHNMTSIQVGDFGFKREHDWHIKHINKETRMHLINFGNHDDTTYKNHPHSTGNCCTFVNYNLMTVRGAYSIDKHHRDEGRSWWSDEELTYAEMEKAIAQSNKYKPEILVTHDCPQLVREELFGITDKSLTSNGLQVMFEQHQPRLWIFGHHHKSRNEVINGTRFICLKELETLII